MGGGGGGSVLNACVGAHNVAKIKLRSGCRPRQLKRPQVRCRGSEHRHKTITLSLWAATHWGSSGRLSYTPPPPPPPPIFCDDHKVISYHILRQSGHKLPHFHDSHKSRDQFKRDNNSATDINRSRTKSSATEVPFSENFEYLVTLGRFTACLFPRDGEWS